MDASYITLKKTKIQPSTVYDIGGNLGCFAAYAKAVWPNCRVVSVEPHPTNFAVLKSHADQLQGVTPVFAALATSEVRWNQAIGGESNPGGHSYFCECVGYEAEELEKLPLAKCPWMTMKQIAEAYPPGGEYMVKLDAEGGEECLFNDNEGTDFIRGAAYIAAELHFFAAKHREIPEVDRLKPGLMGTHGHVIRAFLDWIYGFSETHLVECEIFPNSANMWCTKK